MPKVVYKGAKSSADPSRYYLIPGEGSAKDVRLDLNGDPVEVSASQAKALREDKEHEFETVTGDKASEGGS